MNFLKYLWHKEDVKKVDSVTVLNEIAKALDCTYSKDIDPISLTYRHCFYYDVCGKRFEVASISAEAFDDYSSSSESYDNLISSLKFERDHNVNMIKDGLECISRIDCTMKY